MTPRTWNWPQFTLAMVSLIGLIAMTLIEQWFGKMADPATKQIVIGLATLAFAFFFNSSAGSRAKDETIVNLAAGPNGNGKPPTKVEVVSTPDKPVQTQEVRGQGVGFTPPAPETRGVQGSVR